METNEMMANEEVMDLIEETPTNGGSGKGLKTIVGIGLVALAGGLAYKYIVKPVSAKIKSKKESADVVIVSPNQSEDTHINVETKED